MIHRPSPLQQQQQTTATNILLTTSSTLTLTTSSTHSITQHNSTQFNSPNHTTTTTIMMLRTYQYSSLLLLWLWSFVVVLDVQVVTGFVTTTTSSRTSSRTSPLYVLYDPAQTSTEFVDFPTPEQKRTLRKEASQRLARKTLPSLSVVPPNENKSENINEIDNEIDNECGWAPQTISQIWDLLSKHELVQIRGICRSDGHTKQVFSEATRLCLELEYHQELNNINNSNSNSNSNNSNGDGMVFPVALLSTKGHSAILYSPTLPLDDPHKFLLRTSVGQKNTWKAKVKAPRDHRGQIIKE